MRLATRRVLRLALGALLAVVLILVGATPAGLLALLGASLLGPAVLAGHVRWVRARAAAPMDRAHLTLLPVLVVLLGTLSCALPDGGIDGPPEVIWETPPPSIPRYDLLTVDGIPLPAIAADSSVVVSSSFQFDFGSSAVHWSEVTRVPGMPDRTGSGRGWLDRLLIPGGDQRLAIQWVTPLAVVDTVQLLGDSLLMTVGPHGPSALGPGRVLLFRQMP